MTGVLTQLANPHSWYHSDLPDAIYATGTAELCYICLAALTGQHIARTTGLGQQFKATYILHGKLEEIQLVWTLHSAAWARPGNLILCLRDVERNQCLENTKDRRNGGRDIIRAIQYHEVGWCGEDLLLLGQSEKGGFAISDIFTSPEQCRQILTSPKDSELWYRNGNCFVHLYKRGQSGRGPSFKVPFDALLEAKCHPLISRFIARDVLAHRHRTAQLGHDDLNVLQRASPGARIELYIPPPAMASRETSQRYYIAMRNFFAWVFRRSMVGEHLGMALVWLLNTMSQLRCPGEDNMGDLVSYMDEEGYLDMRNQPVHALAILHFAEYFQCRSLYIDAFTHCTGMSDRLFLVPEYQVRLRLGFS